MSVKSSLLERRGAGQRQTASSHKASPCDTPPLTRGLEKSQDLMNHLLLCEIKIIAKLELEKGAIFNFLSSFELNFLALISHTVVSSFIHVLEYRSFIDVNSV